MTNSSKRRQLNINSATVKELANASGLNATLARRIIAHRPFSKLKELLHVRGIEPEIYSRAAPRLRVGPPVRLAKRPKPAQVRKRRTRVSPPARRAPPPEAQPPAIHVESIAAQTITSGERVERLPLQFDSRSVKPTPIVESTPHPLSAPRAAYEPIISTPPPATITNYTAPRHETQRASSSHRVMMEEVIYDPGIVFVEAEPAYESRDDTQIVAIGPRSVAVRPAFQIGDAGPRTVFSLMSAAVAIALLGFIAGVIAVGRLTVTASPEPALPPVAIRVVTAAASFAAPTSNVASITAPPSPPPSTPTPNFVPNSGLVGAGTQLFNETFNPAGYWNVGENDFSNIIISDYRLSIQMKRLGVIAWTTNGYVGGDFFYQGDTYVGSCQRDDYYGLVFRSRNNDRTLFGISCGGEYRVIQQHDDQYDDLIGFTFTPTIVAGSKAANLLAVRAQKAQLRFYVNDQYVASIETADPTPGLFGAFVRASQTRNLRVDFDDLAAWQINP